VHPGLPARCRGAVGLTYGEGMRRRQHDQAPEVVSITAAPQRHSDDLDARISRYLVSMLIRTVCVVLVVVIDSPVRWLFAVGAVGLPYVAVVMANASGTRRRQGPVRPVGPMTPNPAPSLSAADEDPLRLSAITPEPHVVTPAPPAKDSAGPAERVSPTPRKAS
jgi:hypothetical protein